MKIKLHSEQRTASVTSANLLSGGDKARENPLWRLARAKFGKWYRIFRSFRLEWKKRNTSEVFHLFRTFSSEMS